MSWKTLRRRYLRGWDIVIDGVTLLMPSTITVSRYRYRGAADPHALDTDPHHNLTPSLELVDTPTRSWPAAPTPNCSSTPATSTSPDDSLPAYDEAAAALLIERVLAFLDRIG